LGGAADLAAAAALGGGRATADAGGVVPTDGAARGLAPVALGGAAPDARFDPPGAETREAAFDRAEVGAVYGLERRSAGGGGRGPGPAGRRGASQGGVAGIDFGQRSAWGGGSAGRPSPAPSRAGPRRSPTGARGAPPSPPTIARGAGGRIGKNADPQPGWRG